MQPFSSASRTRRKSTPPSLCRGHFKKAGVTPKRHLAEFKGFEGEYNLGDSISVDFFTEADFVDIVGTSKGKGYQGVVKRHGFGGVGQATHGQHNRLRKPGSIGACSLPRKGIQRHAYGRPHGQRGALPCKTSRCLGYPRKQPAVDRRVLYPEVKVQSC